MPVQDIKSYITYLSIFQVIVCRFCEICIPPKDPLRHYEDNHTAKKDYPVPMQVRRKIADYMATLDLCQPQEIIPPHVLVPELKVLKEGFVCKFPGCGTCAISESSMRKHYYVHQNSVPKTYKNWESTSLQTFFDGQHRKYIKLFNSALMIDISLSAGKLLKMIKLLLMC
jgi:Orsellinic acid/F9775 biosynthesis cluster protein D